MFETPAIELGSGHGSFEPGIDQCVVEIAGRPIGHAVHLEITLQPAEITPGIEHRLATTLRRCCDERSRANEYRRRSMQRSGVSALRPVTLFGLAITAFAFDFGDDPQTAVVDIVGWVLAWLGLLSRSTRSSATRATTCARTARSRRSATHPVGTGAAVAP